MKCFVAILFIALTHGAFAQRGFFSSLGNAAYANADAINSLIGNVGSAANMGINTARGAVGLGTSAGRMGVNAATGLMGGVVNANLNAMGAINNRFVPSGIATPVNHMLNAGYELEQAKTSAINNMGAGVFNGIDAMANAGAGISSFGVDAVTGAMQGGTNMIAGAVNGFTGAMSALSNLANLPQNIMTQVKPMVGQFINNMPAPTMRLMNRLKQENVFDFIKEKMDEIKHQVQEIGTHEIRNIVENIQDLRQELIGNFTSMIRGDDNGTAIPNMINSLETRIPVMAIFDSQIKSVMEDMKEKLTEFEIFVKKYSEIIDKYREEYIKIRSKLTDEQMAEMNQALKTDFINLLKGNSSAIDDIVSQMEFFYPDIVQYEADIRSGLESLQKAAKDVSGFLPLFDDIIGKVGEIVSFPETQAFVNQAKRNMQSIQNTPGYNNLMSSIPSLL